MSRDHEKAILRSRKYQNAHRERVRAATEKWNKENKEFFRSYKMRTRYGIDIIFYLELFAEQLGRCAICRRNVRLGVDHDHKTKRVRGLLCLSCNYGLGNFKDDPYLLRQAASYLLENADD